MYKNKALWSIITISALSPVPILAKPVNWSQKLVAMQRQIDQQQHELKQQSEEIALLKHQSSPFVNKAKQTPQHNTTISYTKTPVSKIPLLKRASTAPNTTDIPVPVLKIGNKEAQLTFNGFINSLIMNADDGKADNTFYTSAPPLSRITFTGKLTPSPNFTAGARTQLGFNINQSNAVSQINQSPGQAVDIRIAEVFVKSKYFGTISLGKGLTASDNTAYSDFSGTAMLARATLQDIGGGLLFRDSGSNALSSITVGNTINGLDGFARRVRVRYDTPSFHGIQLAASISEGERQDLALKFAKRIGSTDFAAQTAITSHQTVSSGANIAVGDVINTSAGFLLKNGLSLSGSWADLMAKQPGRDDPYYFYIKPGYQQRFFNVGLTALSIDMGRYYNFLQNNSTASGYGVQIAQNLNPYGLAVYTGYRHFNARNTGQSLKGLNLFLLGALFKF